MPRRRSSSRRRTRPRGSSTRRSRRRSRGRTQRRKRQREKSSSDVRKNDGGKKDGKKKAKKAEKPDKKETDEKPEKTEKDEKQAEKQPEETKEKPDKPDKPETADADKADKVEKPDKPKDKPDKADKKPGKNEKAKGKKTKDGKGKAEKGDEKNDKTKSKSESKKDPAAKADAKKKAKAKKDKGKSSSYDSSYSSSSSSSDDDEDQQQQQQQYLNAMSQWAMMQGMPTAMGTSQMGMAGYAQYAGGQYPGYGAGAYGYSDPYGRPYGSMGEQVPAGCGYMQGVTPPPPPPMAPPGAPPPPAPPPYMHGPMTEEERLADERDKARRRLEDETRLRNEELHRKADAEKALAAIKNATIALQNGQSDALDNLQKTLENLVQRDLPKCESQAESLKKDMNKAIQEATKRKEALRELKSMVRSGEEHIKATAELIRQNLALDKEKDREEMNDQLENAGLEAQGMSDRYQSFMEERLKSLEELQSVTKGPALVDMRLIIAKIKKLGSDLTQTATNAANVVREGKDKLARCEMAVEQTQRIKDMFALYDADEDGFLSKQEVIQYAQGEFEFTPPESCMDRLWRNLVTPGKAGIAFDCFQQMKVTIGAARVIEKERRKAQSTEAAATLNGDAC